MDAALSIPIYFESEYSFPAADGIAPAGALVRSTDGNFYGTTSYGGEGGGYGTVFRMSADGTLTTLHTFNSLEGAYPAGALLLGADGAFYGTANGGGTNDLGTVFRMTADGTVTVLHSFTGADGEYPDSGVMQASDGNFYGVAVGRDAAGYGTVFKITPAGAFSTLYNLAPDDGDIPSGTLTEGADSQLYGVTRFGGTADGGTLFKVSTSGVFTKLHDLNGIEGELPVSGLLLANDGNFYGVTRGSSNGTGTVFRMTPAGTVTVLHEFPPVVTANEGQNPNAGLIQGADGKLYGTSEGGGNNANGTIFSITLAGTLTTLHLFDGTDGSSPENALVQASTGDLFGVAFGGPGQLGVAFKVSTGGAYSRLHDFELPDGGLPLAGLTAYPDGSFYGVNALGGSNGGYGTLFHLDSAGNIEVLHGFANTDGNQPEGSLIVGGDGALYGTAYEGGDHFSGTVFRATVDGGFSVLHSFAGSFCGTGEAYPQAGLVEDAGGILYGSVTQNGLFSLAEDGSHYRSLHTFTGADGSVPNSSLVPGPDRDFYGTTFEGGDNGTGTVYRTTSDGIVTVVHSFGPVDGMNQNADGAQPVGQLLFGPDGNWYGTTVSGGSGGRGTVFRLAADGTLTNLANFSCDADGGLPDSGLVLGPDGNFYGTTSQCKNSTLGGMVFQLTPAGALTPLHVFSGLDGLGPNGNLLFADDGYLYGTTASGGNYGVGTIFRLQLLPSAPVAAASRLGSASFTLSWNAIPGATGYNLYVGTQPGQEDNTPALAGITGTSITYDARSSGTTYYFQVSAINHAGEGPRSAELAATSESGGGAFDERLLAGLTFLLLLRRMLAARPVRRAGARG